MLDVSKQLQNEQDALEAEKVALAKKIAREEELERKEREKFKEAMDAQRRLDKVDKEETETRKKAERDEKEQNKSETKGSDGKCKACGFKKCKKSCMFYNKLAGRDKGRAPVAKPHYK